MTVLEPKDIDLADPDIKRRYNTVLTHGIMAGNKKGGETDLKEFIATMESSRLKNEAYTKAHPERKPPTERIKALENEVAGLKQLLQEVLDK